MEKLLTPQEASNALGVSVSTLAQMRYLGTGPKYQRISPRKIRYKESALEEFVQSTTRQGTAVA